MDIENLVRETIEKSITAFFQGKVVNVEHVLDLIFPRERRIRSLIGGLETSLGTRLWEPLAKAFAREGGFSVLDEKEFNGRVPVLPAAVRHLISDFEEKKSADMSLTHDSFVGKLDNCIKNIDDLSSVEYRKIPKGQGVDLWIKKDNIEYLIDIKTTQINAGGGPKFNTNMLNWYAYRAILKKQSGLEKQYKTKCLLAFPFNPHKNKNFWDKEGGKVKPLIPKDEALVADEFWDLLYGKTNTTELIFREFKKLGEENFGKRFSDIFNPMS